MRWTQVAKRRIPRDGSINLGFRAIEGAPINYPRGVHPVVAAGTVRSNGPRRRRRTRRSLGLRRHQDFPQGTNESGIDAGLLRLGIGTDGTARYTAAMDDGKLEAMRDPDHDEPVPAYLEIKATIECPPRSDGYRPIADPVFVWGRTLGMPPLAEYRLVLAAARRLDSGHLQLERVREGIATAPPMGSPAGRWRLHEVVGDAELTIIALDKSLDIILKKLTGSARVSQPIPAIIRSKQPLMGRLRDHYEHIEERALGKIRGKNDRQAEGAWELSSLFSERKFTDGIDSLGIDEEATALCLASRSYLLGAWSQLVERARQG
jgi:hypothetical protein